MEFTPRTEPELKKDLKMWGGDIRQDLQQTFHDPLHRLADRIDELVDTQPDLVNEVAQMRPADEVPYGVHDLPPDLFDHSESKPFIPRSETERTVFMDSYWSTHLRLHASTPGFHAHATFPEHRENLTANLKRRHNEDIQIDEAEWATYQDSYRAQLERGFYTLGHNAAVMNIPRILGIAAARNTFGFASGRQKNYQLASMDSPHSTGLYLRVPEGGYGPEFAERLLRTASFLYDYIHQDRVLREDLQRQYEANPGVVNTHTERAVMNRHLYSPEESMVVTIQEGIGSILGAINLATAEKVEGYEGADSLLDRVVADRLPDKMALIFPLGVAGAAATFGTYFPGMINPTGGSLSFNGSMLDNLAQIKERATRILYEEWVAYHNAVAEANPTDSLPLPPTRTGLTCPAAGTNRHEVLRRESAIARLSKTVLNVYNTVHHQPNTERRTQPWMPPMFENSR